MHGLWEAKDENDDLQREIKSKAAQGYPLTNILFQSPSRAVLYQDNRIAFDSGITTPEKLIEVLQFFCEHKQAHKVDWETAVIKFAEKIPELAGVTKILVDEDLKNPAFRQNFQSFAELCRQPINPDLTDNSIRKMLVQHLLPPAFSSRSSRTRSYSAATSSPTTPPTSSGSYARSSPSRSRPRSSSPPRPPSTLATERRYGEMAATLSGP